ncbi:MAG: 3-phosphoshikimate 1-carboxyvinyltransferase [Clostridia bacterium]|nr:3-phosphoshikimate 1-carboxyvinyltransferase [Clostridia bacterium]
MKVKIEPCTPCGTVKAPPSKSEAHRAIICAALANGESVISNIAFSDDISATVGCAVSSGCDIKTEDGKITVSGTGGNIGALSVLNCRESGSTLRFMLPLCLLSEKETALTGSERLFERPLGVYEKICRKQDIPFIKERNSVTVGGKLHSGEFEVSGNVSSQFISGLMLALPLTEGDSVIKIIPPFESRPYVFLTAKIMDNFGVKAVFEDEYTVRIQGGQHYRPCGFAVGGDWSNAAYLYAFDGVKVHGVDESSVQGDRVCREYFKRLKSGFCTLELSDCPDLAPIMFAYAAAHDGGRFTGTDRLRFKESDRISCMKEELSKLGVMLSAEENTVTVTSGTLRVPDGELYGHNDHRIVMALSYLLTFTGGIIDGAQAVSKSFPDYFEVIKQAGISVTSEQEKQL